MKAFVLTGCLQSFMAVCWMVKLQTAALMKSFLSVVTKHFNYAFITTTKSCLFISV